MSDRFDVVLADWISEGPDRGPEEGLRRALAATRGIAQRPGWTFPQRWLPAPVAEKTLRLPQLAGVSLLVLLSLLLLIALAVAFAGAERPVRPPHLGPAADRLVAYQDGGALYVARLDGSGRRVISGGREYARSPVFSPDGSRIAFVSPPSADALGGPILIAAADGSGDTAEVSQGLDVVAANVAPLTWSPDGTQIAFVARDGGVTRIFVAAIDGSQVTPITDGTANADLPTWSPDGTLIGYRVTEADGVRKHLRKVRPDGSATEDVTTMIAADASLSRLHWRQDGAAVSYAVNFGFGTETRAVIDLGFGHIAELWPAGVGGFADAGIPWSRDGAHLAFISATEGVILAENGPTAPYEGELRMLGAVADCWVEWAPDSTALYGGSPDGCDGVVVIPIAEPGAAISLPTTTSGLASWQPLAE